ncbi:glucose-6-phosphate isomerase [Serratia fonticola]|uniref:glucose-6-phosphate isomerase n=1 Tax=Serratia fonticola TaxID=47917 RepID=A0A4U9W719_SERFO|nr:glucose-6-phosphate isomerase [Serratia fonticola]
MMGRFTAPDVQHKSTTLGNLAGIFADRHAWQEMPAEFAVYSVEMLPSPSQEGELFVGTTHLQAGKVGNEFFMTRGHFTSAVNRPSSTSGCAVRACSCCNIRTVTASLRQVFAGSVHHIPSFTAHRLINIGDEVLSALAVWPTVAGHDYIALQPQGFKLRVFADGAGLESGGPI